jgi:hypothetical protein
MISPKLIRRKPLKHDRVLPLRRQISRRTPHRGAAVGGLRYVTVCIAAISERGQAIVLVADRAISSVRGGQTVLKADAGVRKIRELRDGWAGLISGPIDFGERVLFIAENAYGVSENAEEVVRRIGMPECAKLAYQSCRKILIIDQILRPRLLDEEWYHKKVSGTVSRDDAHFARIEKEMVETPTESTLLLCGFEDGIPEIYIVNDPGMLNNASAEGFGVIGIGEDAARSRLFTLETDPRMKWERFFMTRMTLRNHVRSCCPM